MKRLVLGLLSALAVLAPPRWNNLEIVSLALHAAIAHLQA